MPRISRILAAVLLLLPLTQTSCRRERTREEKLEARERQLAAKVAQLKERQEQLTKKQEEIERKLPDLETRLARVRTALDIERTRWIEKTTTVRARRAGARTPTPEA